MPNISVRLTILIVATAMLTSLATWRLFLNPPPSQPNLSDAEAAIREDRLSGNIQGLLEKAYTLPPKDAEKAILAIGRTKGDSIGALRKILVADKKPRMKQRALQATAMVIRQAAKESKKLDPKMTAVLTNTLANDESAEVRGAAARTIGELYDYTNVPSLLKAMNDESIDVRRKAHRAVSRIWGRTYEFDLTAPANERQTLIDTIADDWKVHQAQVGKFLDDNRTP